MRTYVRTMDTMAPPPEVPAEIALLDVAIDRFCELPLPDACPTLASFLMCVRQSVDRLELKFPEIKTDDNPMLAIPPQLDLYQQLARGPSVEVAA